MGDRKEAYFAVSPISQITYQILSSLCKKFAKGMKENFHTLTLYF